MKTIFLFPGQGAQYQGMARDLWEKSDGVKRMFDFASDKTGVNMTHLLFEGSEEELKATDNTQIAVTLANLSAAHYLHERGIESSGSAGVSLGEYSALYEAGVIGYEDIFPIVKKRGEIMEKASRNLDSLEGEVGMAAVIGLPFDEASKVLEELKGEDVYLANHSSPIQIVLSGTAEGLSKAEEYFDEAGALKYVYLKVSGPFHSPLLEEAGRELEKALAPYTFNDPSKTVYANVSGDRIGSGAEAKRFLVRQMVSTVRWVEEEEKILDDGYDRILEVGPGKVLTGLWKSFYKELRCTPVGTVEAIEGLTV
jgi:[acyl-carrier-protein] S-malonyltransferase